MKTTITKLHLTLLALALQLFSMVALAQAPQKMSYQAVIRNASNNILANTTVGMRISILQGSPTGTPLYVELQTPTTNVNGLVSLEIGGGLEVLGPFSSINWASGGPFYIKTETDVAGGTRYTITGTTQLLSVPFALYALTSGSGGGSQGPAGPTGPQGPQGIAGPAGPTGPQGAQGAQGIAGPTGPQGPIGATGPAGATGAQGPQGIAGPTGPTGPAGTAGATGAQGPQGIAGPTGPTGPIGATGPAGATGAQGPQGIAGPAGPTGPIGATGPAGANGANGLDGATGPQGPQGIAGPTGPTGPIGATGPAGANGANGLDGATGPQGPQGDPGLPGSNGLDGATGPTGDTGPQGPQGPQGDPGLPGANGLDGATGPTGPTGPAPSGTGIVTVNGGVLGTPGPLTGDVTTSGDGLVTTIGDNTITTSKIVDGTITTADISNSTIDLTTKVTGILPVSNGGTGQGNNLTQYGVIYAPTTTTMGSTDAGSSGQVFMSNGGTSAPSWQDLKQSATTVFSSAGGSITTVGSGGNIPGLSITVTVPAGYIALLSSYGGVQNTGGSATNAACIVDVYFTIDGALATYGGYQRLLVGNNRYEGVSAWSMTTRQTLSAGSHTITVGGVLVAKNGTTVPSSVTLGGATGNVLQGELSVILIRQ